MTTPPEIITGLMEALKASQDKTSPFDMDPVCAPTGSRVICTPPVTNTDNDWLVFVPDALQDEAVAYLERQGATHSAAQDVYPDGVCFHFGEVNPILIWDYTIFYRWVAATYWAHRMNLTSKEDRIAFFSALVDSKPSLDSLIL